MQNGHHYVRMLTSQDGQTVYIGERSGLADARTLARDLETGTGLKWSLVRIPLESSRFRHEHSINRALAYQPPKARAATA
ncbi:MAG: hypothetical protein KGL39_33055 [Patescibacteria group bacterium]|nr:hypothetical protein [Patescibacteria group bacterium]